MYFVFVISLAPEVAAIRRFRDRNPRMEEDAQCFFVGCSNRDPDDAFAALKNSDFYVRRYGRWLSRLKYESRNPVKTRREAEKLSSELTRSLRADGCGVWTD